MCNRLRRNNDKQCSLTYPGKYIDGTRTQDTDAVDNFWSSESQLIFKTSVYNFLSIIQVYIITSPFLAALDHRVGC